MISITVDGEKIEVEKDRTVLEVLKERGIDIPTLCYHPSLKPSGSCRLCAVEVFGRATGRKVTMLSCILKVKEGLEIKTSGELVERARVRAFRNLLQMAPQSRRLTEMARAYGVDVGTPPDGCIRCRLCVRVCKEIVGAGALKMEKREGVDYVVPIEDACIGCGTCANICPTDAIRVEDRDNVRTITIRDAVIGRHPLERCEGCGRYFATTRFLGHIHERTDLHPHLKVEHKYCPTCAKLFSDRIRSVSDRSRK
jgi:predicted molibdopterin-dependent oxidoreductase YjgC